MFLSLPQKDEGRSSESPKMQVSLKGMIFHYCMDDLSLEK